MKPLPHEYSVTGSAGAVGNVLLRSHDLATLSSAPPLDFDGPGDLWSPEEFLLAAVVDCFILTFRSVARASNLPWKSIEARVDGVLARVDRVTRFTELTIHATLTLDGDETPEEMGLRVLEKSEKTCLITNSLAVPVKLEARVQR